MKFIKATNNLRAVFGFLIIAFSAASGLAQAKTEIPQKTVNRQNRAVFNNNICCSSTCSRTTGACT